MPERPWVCISPEDRSRVLIYVKHLALINPGTRAAKECELQIEEPSLISYTGIDDTPFVFRAAGQILEAPKFTPSQAVGIEFEAIPPWALTNGSMASREIEGWSWVAFVEAIGNVYTRDEDRVVDYRYAKTIRVKELRAYCFGCLKEAYPIPVTRDRPMGESLKQGLAVEPFPGLNGEGHLGAICSVEKHPIFADLVRYNFQIAENGEFILTDLPK